MVQLSSGPRDVQSELVRQRFRLAMATSDLVGCLPGALVGLLELDFAPLELSDVGVDRDRPTSGHTALGDHDPASARRCSRAGPGSR